MIYYICLEYNSLHYPQDNRFKDLLKLSITRKVLSRFGTRKIAMHELREKNVDILNKTYYESGIWSAIESRCCATATAKFRLDFFLSPVFPISRPRPRYRVPVIISPVSLSSSIIKSLRIYLLSELRKLI